MGSQKAHALVLPFPAQGHINPMLQFSKRLVSKGIKITFINSIFLSKTIHANLDHTSINFETISDGFDDGGLAAATDESCYVDILSKVGSKSLTELIKKLEASGNTVNALIYDSFLIWGLDVAKEFGLIGAAFSTQSCAIMNVYYHVFKGILPIPLPDSQPVVLPGLPELQQPEMPSFVFNYGTYPGFTDMVMKQFSNIDGADWFLCNTFYKLEEDVLNKWMKKHWRVITVGPTIPSMFLDKRLEDDSGYGVNFFKPDSSLCLNWLNKQAKQSSVVYLSMGSWSQLKAGQTEEIAAALKNSGFNFLWVVRENEKSKLPENFIDETSEKGLVVGWCPQLEVLAHESTGCFVTHCGFNSVLETLSLGVPVVAMPLWTDQPTNAKFLEDVWGVGLRTERNDQGIVTRESLEYCLKEILEGEKGKQIKENAAKWKKLATEAVDEGGSSDKNIDEFVDDLVRSSTSRS